MLLEFWKIQRWSNIVADLMLNKIGRYAKKNGTDKYSIYNKYSGRQRVREQEETGQEEKT